MRLLALFIGSLMCYGCSQAQVSGCTDPLATNYNAQATVNDGTCTYPAATVTPYQSVLLDDQLIPETSGLILLNGQIWTHNDDTNDTLYSLDTATAQVGQKLAILNGNNTDWEEITQDDNYIYIGDFGNNATGQRQDLHILRVAKININNGSAVPDTIWFQYADQSSSSPSGPNNTDFDCEAFIATADSLYLFSKQWISKKTRLYVLPNVPGSYTAAVRGEYDVQGMITGATYLPAKRMIVTVGYNINTTGLTPFLFLLYDFRGTDFLGGNKRKLGLNISQHQTEGITTFDGRKFFVSNESYSNALINIKAKLHKIDLNSYLDTYYRALTVNSVLEQGTVKLFPNPTAKQLELELRGLKQTEVTIEIRDAAGRNLLTVKRQISSGTNRLTLTMPPMTAGNYWLHISAGGNNVWRSQFAYKAE